MYYLGVLVFRFENLPIKRVLFRDRRTLVVAVAVNSKYQEGMDFNYLFHEGMDFNYLFHYIEGDITIDTGTPVYESN